MFARPRQRALVSSGTLAFLASVLLALGPSRAHAEPELALTWRESAGCPDAAWAERRVRERLGRTLVTDGDRSLYVDATLAHEGDRYRLTLRTGPGESGGDRTLSAQNCGDLAEAAALMIALALDARTSVQVQPAQAPLDAERPPALRPPRPAARAPRSPRLVAMRAAAVASVGDQPAWGIGPLFAFAYEWSRYRVELAGFWLVPRTGGETSSGKVRVRVWALRPTVCGRLVDRTLQVSACGGMELGRITGEGLGFDERQRDQLFWQAAFLGPRLALGLPSALALVLEVHAVGPFNRPRFVSLEQGEATKREVHASAPVVGRATFGLELRF